MGQAKQRGTYEERSGKATIERLNREAEARKVREDKERADAEAKKAHWDSLSKDEKLRFIENRVAEVQLRDALNLSSIMRAGTRYGRR